MGGGRGGGCGQGGAARGVLRVALTVEGKIDRAERSTCGEVLRDWRKVRLRRLDRRGEKRTDLPAE